MGDVRSDSSLYSIHKQPSLQLQISFGFGTPQRSSVGPIWLLPGRRLQIQSFQRRCSWLRRMQRRQWWKDPVHRRPIAYPNRKWFQETNYHEKISYEEKERLNMDRIVPLCQGRGTSFSACAPEEIRFQKVVTQKYPKSKENRVSAWKTKWVPYPSSPAWTSDHQTRAQLSSQEPILQGVLLPPVKAVISLTISNSFETYMHIRQEGSDH
jgi:hypothetical protein